MLNRRSLFASAGIGAATVVLGRSVAGKDELQDYHEADKDDDSKDHSDDSSHGSDDDVDVQPAGTVPAGSAEVRIDDDDSDGFEPGTITINVGESVTWVNVDKDPHTATGGSFDTGRIEPGQQATVTFDEPGSFPYSCAFHPIMTGTVEVKDEGGNVPGRAAASPQASPSASPHASPTSAQKEAVAISNFAFDPQELQIKVGTTVEWTNNDAAPHTATANDDSFDSGTLNPGDKYSHTFTEAGTYDYFCAVHPNMKAKIVVSN